MCPWQGVRSPRKRLAHRSFPGQCTEGQVSFIRQDHLVHRVSHSFRLLAASSICFASSACQFRIGGRSEESRCFAATAPSETAAPPPPLRTDVCQAGTSARHLQLTFFTFLNASIIPFDHADFCAGPSSFQSHRCREFLPFNGAVYSGRPSPFGAAQPRNMALGRPQILAALPDIEAACHQEVLRPLEPSLSGIL